jgi:hypothetical protein
MDGLEKYRTAAASLAKGIRHSIDRSRPVLFHGTRYARNILRNDELCSAPVGLAAVSFSRQLEISIYWAILDRDDDEGQGAILVLDRDRLTQKYKLQCRRDQCLNHGFPRMYTEAEEIVYGRDIEDLHKYLVDTVWVDEHLMVGQTTKQLREATHLRLPRRRPAIRSRMRRSCLPSGVVSRRVSNVWRRRVMGPSPMREDKWKRGGGNEYH